MGIDYTKCILELRVKLDLTQEELAKKLGVSFQSVNRWENGHFKPNKIMKYKLVEIFKQNGVSM